MLKVFIQKNCPTCQKLKDTLSKSIGVEYELINKEEKNKEQFIKYNVLTIPVSIIIDDSGVEIDRFYGAKDSQKIKEFIKEAY